MNGYFVRNSLDGKRANAMVEIKDGKRKPISLHFFLEQKEAKKHAKLLNGHTEGRPWRVEAVNA